MNPENVCRSGLAAALFVAVFLVIPLQAAPIVDELDTLDNIHNDSNSCTFKLVDGRLETTWKSGYFGGIALMGWNIGGTGALDSNLSLNPIDHQHQFVMNGISPITPAGKEPAYLSVIFYTSETGAAGTGRRAAQLEVAQDATDFVFDVASLGKTGYWSAQVEINTNSTANAGYSFDTISAIPEPASLSLLALGGLAALKRKRA